jgi:hypothetical protein
VSGWYALFVPAKTPKDIIQKMATAQKPRPTIHNPEAAEKQGMIVGLDARRTRIKAELDKWGALIKEADRRRALSRVFHCNIQAGVRRRRA